MLKITSLPDWKWVVIVLFAIFLLSACSTSTPIYTPEPTNTPSPSLTPTSTPTLTPTSTPTVIPTQSSDQIAEILGLPFEMKLSEDFSYFHKYRFDDNNLVDDYNGSIAAQKNTSGDWVRVLDDTIKYGALANRLGLPYVGSTKEWQGGLPEVVMADIRGVFTGEYRVVNYDYPRLGKTISDYQGAMVYRDSDGKVKKVWVSMFSPDMPGLIKFSPSYELGLIGEEGLTLDEALIRYQPGQKWDIQFAWDGEQLPIRGNTCYPPPSPNICSENKNRIALLRRGQDRNLHTYVESINDKGYSEIPEDLVIPANFVAVLYY
jgi:hypothetical protein